MVEYLLGGALFDNLAFVHHGHVVGYLGDDAEVVGDEDDADMVPLLERPQQLEDGLLHGDIECGGRLVGNDEVGVADEGHGNHDTLLLPTADFVGIAGEYLFGPREHNLLKQVEHTLACLVAGHPLVGKEHLHDLVATTVDRVEAGHGFLEYHANAATADIEVGILVEGEEVGFRVIRVIGVL